VQPNAARGVDFLLAPGGIRLHSVSSEAGEADVMCGVQDGSTASPCKVKLDPQFVQEFLSGLPVDGEPVVRIYSTDSSAPVVFMSDDHRAVIMPLAGE